MITPPAERHDDLPTRPLRIAAAQAPVVRGDIAANAAQAAALIRRAAAEGARLVVFAEKFLTGYEAELISSDPLRYAVTADDPRLAPITTACRESGTIAVVGAVTRAADGLRVSALVVDATGTVAACYAKQHLFDAEVHHYLPGTAGCTLEVDGWRLGLGVCYDSGFPEHARAAALDGCHAYLVGALFSVGGGEQQVRVWFPARALDNTVYTLLANHVGHTGGWNTCGGSAVWGPDGRLLAQAAPEGTDLAVADLDPAQLRRVRADLRMLTEIAGRDAAVAAGPRNRHALS
ncbi:carbon-nitrogen hydrolase family protein [Kitasatospora nipponensis]|uniref:Carbon-nitrogen hydrolase family protein n=1 Tax=Kitasatospora nipponensis TaxID=258049 RepID=A0ABP4HN31_9ACTN